MIKSQRITSKYFNKSKFEDVKDILRRIAAHKNTLSHHIFDNKIMLLTEDGVRRLKSDYKIVKDDYISSWNIQEVRLFCQLEFTQNILYYRYNKNYISIS